MTDTTKTAETPKGDPATDEKAKPGVEKKKPLSKDEAQALILKLARNEARHWSGEDRAKIEEALALVDPPKDPPKDAGATGAAAPAGAAGKPT